jgi:hypothetical protein
MKSPSNPMKIPMLVGSILLVHTFPPIFQATPEFLAVINAGRPCWPKPLMMSLKQALGFIAWSTCEDWMVSGNN